MIVCTSVITLMVNWKRHAITVRREMKKEDEEETKKVSKFASMEFDQLKTDPDGDVTYRTNKKCQKIEESDFEEVKTLDGSVHL